MKQGKLRPWFRMLGMTILGSAIFALGFDLFLLPNQINIGGVSGIGMLLLELTGCGSVGLYSILINVPLFILGGKRLGRQFFFGSLAGMLTSSLLMDVFTRITPPQTEILLSALYGGIFSGVGLGLVFLGGASTGGSDIGARLLRRRFGSLPLGRILLTIDLTIVALTGAVYHDVSKALYSAVPLYVSSVVMDGIIYGLDYSTVALIISEQLGVKAGLGWYINWATQWGEYYKVFASVGIFIIIFYLLINVLFKVRDRVMTWQKSVVRW